MRRGDILWVDLSTPPGGAGREQAGIRPSVAVSLGDDDSGNPMITVVPMTTALRKGNYPHTMTIDPSSQNGLQQKSVLLGFQVVSLDKRRVVRVAGSLEDEHIQELDNLLRNLMSL